MEAVDVYWKTGAATGKPLRPHEAAVTLLANRIASHPAAVDAVYEYTQQWCRVKVAAVKTADAKNDEKFQTYHGFESPLNRLRDHQVLAIRRGVDKKALKLSFDVDSDRAEGERHCWLRQRHPLHQSWVWILASRLASKQPA